MQTRGSFKEFCCKENREMRQQLEGLGQRTVFFKITHLYVNEMIP